MNDEQCPKCGAVFPADRAWAHRTVAGVLLYRGLDDLDTRVRCPRCNNVFEAAEFRFFGFLSPGAMRIGIGLFLLLSIATAVYFLFIDAP